MCRLCRNEYMRLRKARAKHGSSLEGYKPNGPLPVKTYTVKVKIRAVPKDLDKWPDRSGQHLRGGKK
jgi:hypothetical protein